MHKHTHIHRIRTKIESFKRLGRKLQREAGTDEPSSQRPSSVYTEPKHRRKLCSCQWASVRNCFLWEGGFPVGCQDSHSSSRTCLLSSKEATVALHQNLKGGRVIRSPKVPCSSPFLLYGFPSTSQHWSGRVVLAVGITHTYCINWL